jgi:hypothetical protein
MSPETIKIIQEQIDSLPKKVREVIASIDITNEVANLRTKHFLMLDQVSTLELETILAMIGLEPTENFVENIKDNLKISEEKAILIANDINESIFNKIRQVMMSTGEEKMEDDNNLDRESILKEIENPTPTFPTIKIEQVPKIQSNIPEIAPIQTIQKYARVEPIKSIIEKKLSEPTHTEPKQTEIFLKKIPQKNSVDPYKEAI